MLFFFASFCTSGFDIQEITLTFAYGAAYIFHSKMKVQGKNGVKNQQFTHSQPLTKWAAVAFRVLNG